MSKSEWEKGTLKIPAKAWKPLRDGLAVAFNERQVKVFEFALQIHAKMLEMKKGAKRGAFNASTAWSALTSGAASIVPDSFSDDEKDLIERSILGPHDKRTGAIYVPKKKDFPLAVSTKAETYDAEDGTITLNHKAQELTWYVYENNHAVEHARDSYMGKVMFALLAKIQWTRGTGGEFYGNDEYNAESEGSGSGGNYTTATYRMKTKAELEQEEKDRQRSRMGYGYSYSGLGYRR